ncbi:phage tail protein [Actinoplanes sp. CA-252034]|uniref:phage tail protein n=1 Tax=Actinoplanes sp. CA-252034 TaxID=3239906 RepID=UPI003D9737A2
MAHVAQAHRGLLDRPAFLAVAPTEATPLELAADRTADLMTAAAPAEAEAADTAADDEEGSLLDETTAEDADTDTDTDAGPAALAAAVVAAAAVIPAVGQQEPAAPPADVPIMPEPAVELSGAEQSRLTGVRERVATTASGATAVPDAGANATAGEQAVQVPQAESDARAAEQVVTTLATAEKPSIEVVELCARIRELIAGKRPADEEAVIDTRPAEVAKQAGAGVQTGVQQNVDATKAAYGPIGGHPQGPAPATAPGVEPIPAAVPGAPISATTATPDPVPAEQVSLDEDTATMRTRAGEAGLDTDAARLVTSGPVAEARAAQDELTTLAADGPAQALEQQRAALAKSDEDLAALQARAVASLAEARTAHTGGVRDQHDRQKETGEQLRARLSAEADTTYADAQSRVEELLDKVPETAMGRWNTGLPPLTEQFNADLKVVKDQVGERHEGVTGWFVAGWDAVTGLPEWVTRAYDQAESNFGDGVCKLILDISSYVNGIIKIADDIIAGARARITAIFTDELPADQRDWAAQQLAGFSRRLDALHDRATAAKTAFTKELIENAGTAVQAAREKIQQLRKEAQGLWGRFLDAVGRFLDDPVKFVIDGLLEVLGISPPAFWAVLEKVKQVAADIVDAPLAFANNLMDGIGQGFQLFFDNVGKHLITGLLEWLLSGLKQEGITIEIPKEISLRSVVVFCLQLLGVSWARIRKLLVEQLGEKPVAIIEKTAGVIYAVATKGLDGIFEDIQKMLDPKTIVDAIVDAAIRFISETLIVKVAQKIIMLLNPAGAILAALEAIYRVLKWVFTNASRIFHFVEAVVNGLADVISGNVAGVAKTVEKALALLVSPVIDFLADYMGLGGLPGKVADAIKGLQGWVEGVLRSVIKWLVDMGRKLLAKLGIKGDDDKKPAGGGIGERLAFTEGDNTHHLYIDVAGSGATVMVASTPMTVTGWLDHLQKKVTGSGDSEVPQGAGALLTRARGQAAATDSSADKAASAAATAGAAGQAAATPDPALAQTAAEREKALRDTLDELGDLFGEKPLLVRALSVAGTPVDITALTVELGAEILGYRGPKLLIDRATGTGYVARLLARDGSGATFDQDSGMLRLVLASAGELAGARSGTALGRLIVDGSGLAAVRLTKSEHEFTVRGGIDEATADVAFGLLPMVPWTVVEKLGDERLRILTTEWTADVKDNTAGEVIDKHKVYFWHDRKEFDLITDATKAGRDFLTAAYAAHEIRAHTRTEFKELLEDRGGPFKKAFQEAAGNAAAARARDFATGQATSPRNVKAIPGIVYEHNETYGLIRMPDIRPEPLPPEVRQALVATLKAIPPTLHSDLGSSPARLTLVLSQKDDLVKIIQDAIDGKPPLGSVPGKDLIDSLNNWKNLIVQLEMHHVVPEWLTGRESPDVELWVPRILHNFGEGPTDPGFHQVLNGVLRDRLGFAEKDDRSDATKPRINGEASVRRWLAADPGNQKRLKAALRVAYAEWEGARTPGLLDEVRKTIEQEFKQLEAGAT